MRKSLAYALMLSATLGLAACDKKSENTQQSRGRFGFDAGDETLGACRVGNRTRKSTVATFYSCQ